ncbi:MAG: hypothetical protein JW874_04125 [Spirochaetales bacterium]|nr:hypothetical protein [Spirochaetales bacterium]
MGEFYNRLPGTIQEHIRLIARDFEIPDADDTLETVAKVWMGKKEIFENEIARADLVEVDTLGVDDENGALVMTYSGSLVDLGPIIDGLRKVKYTSIGYRKNRPSHAESRGTNLARDMEVDSTAEFDQGPIKRTSQVFKIAVCRGNLASAEKAANITSTKTLIEEKFVEVNKSIDLD